MKFEPQPCSARMNQPKVCWWFRYLQTAPRLIGGRHIDEREADAGDELQDHHREAGAAEDVGPTRAAAGTL